MIMATAVLAMTSISAVPAFASANDSVTVPKLVMSKSTSWVKFGGQGTGAKTYWRGKLLGDIARRADKAQNYNHYTIESSSPEEIKFHTSTPKGIHVRWTYSGGELTKRPPTKRDKQDQKAAIEEDYEKNQHEALEFIQAYHDAH